MILRVLRARVIAGQEARLMRFVREDAVGPALRAPGLLSFQPAIRETRAGLELVIVSSWNDFQDLAGLGGDLDSPLSMPGASDLLADSHAEHYELVIGQARAMPLREAKLRLTRIPIRPNVESSYYEAVRGWADRLLDDSGLVAFSLGRRVIGRQDDIVAVQIWQDEASIRAAGGEDIDKPMGGAELSQFWAAEPSIEHFDALTAVEPRTNAPAIVLVDDQRRYVHATPAAAQLVGRPLARLLTMRVEDIVPSSQRRDVAIHWDRFVADGSARGPYTVERPDGSEVAVKFAAKANAPWPGSHASLMVVDHGGNGAGSPGAGSGAGSIGGAKDGDDLDIDRALVEAGLIAKYAPS